MKPVSAAALALILSCACTSRVSVRKDLAMAAADPSRIQARVVLVEPSPPPASEIRRGGDHTSIVALQPGLSSAVRSMLRATFSGVSQAASPEAAQGAEFLAAYRLAPSGPRAYEGLLLELREPGEPPFFVESWPLMERAPSGNMFIGVLSYIPPFYFLMPVSSASQAMRTRNVIEQSLLKGLEGASAALRREIPIYRRNRALVEAAEGRGDSLSAADPAGALAAYREALAVADPHRTAGRRVLEKYIAVTSRSGASAVPETAKESMARGKVLIARAASAADFRPAVEAMEKAVMAAPGWAAGHFNTALAHEGAGDWRAASEHFAAYLSLKPGAQDADEVRRKIVELKVREEMGDKPLAQ
ncbi:MAG TPA: hypothetical protein DCM05_04605 [Elusimicrobia bacterium]|nr:hypothetical protein [Elusimicrobiota bacterium]